MSDKVTSNNLISQPVVGELAQLYGTSPDLFFATVQKVAMPEKHTGSELMSCLMVAREHRLNPMTKEIYFMKTRAGQIQPIVSVDGWIRKINEHPQFDGIEFDDVRDDKGKLVAMTCTIYRKDRSRPIKVTEEFDECARNGGPVWKSAPYRMMRNRTLCQCARIAFGMAGVMEPDEYEQWQRGPIDITPPTPQTAPEPDLSPGDDASEASTDVSDSSGHGGDASVEDAIELLEDQEGFRDMMEENLSCANSVEDVDEIISSNVDLIDRCLEDIKSEIFAMQDAALMRVKPTAKKSKKTQAPQGEASP